MNSTQPPERPDTGQIDEDTLRARLTARAGCLRRYVAAKIPSELSAIVTAEDILQEVWIAALRGISKFRANGPDALDRWLVTIANRKLLDQIKSVRRLKRGGNARTIRAGRRAKTSLADVFAILTARRRTPSRDASAREASDALRIAVSTLPDDRQRAIRMRYIEGLPPQEIAKTMDRSPAAVKGLLLRGLRELRTRLGNASRFFSDVRSSEMTDE